MEGEEDDTSNVDVGSPARHLQGTIRGAPLEETWLALGKARQDLAYMGDHSQAHPHKP